jgi:hypothetical protein
MRFRELIGGVGILDLSDEPTRITSQRLDLKKINEMLTEAAFSEKNLEKVATLYGKILGKRMGGEFHKISTESYTRKTGPGKGVRMMNDKGAQVRFNYDAKIAKGGSFDMTSIDYWDATNINFQKPTRTVMFKTEFNVVEVLDAITTALLTGHINEARSGAEKQEWLASKGMPKSLAGSEKAMKDRAEKLGLTDELETFLGMQETNTFEDELKSTEQELEKEVFANPETVFEDIEDLLSVVAKKKWRTLVVCGMGGIGKTYHITEGPRSLAALLGPVGGKWEYHAGTKAAPFSFYRTLFQERDKIIVFDEADSLLKNNDIVMMLKPILDTSGANMAAYMSGTENMVGKSDKEIRDYCEEVDAEIAAGTQIGTGKNDVKLPSKFFFEGGMIFISNMRANQIEGAIMSRSIFIDVYLAQQDVLKRIESIAKAKYKSFGEAYVKDLLEGLGQTSKGPVEKVQYMTPEYARKNKPFTVRSMDLAHILKQSGLTRWAELSQLYA